MAKDMVSRLTLVCMLLVAFAIGYVCGLARTPQASAQLPQIPGVSGSNPLAAAGQLGSSITEMEQHVTGLQKNLDTLKKIRSMLGGK
jgi:hypothetical protein